MERRLSAILAADVVGYSRLMGVDEVGTLRRLTELHKTLVHPRISQHKGRTVKLMGDGLLAEFPSAVEAVSCAAGILEQLVLQEANVPPDQRIRMRIGINLGDVIFEGGDIYGDGVNVAARLESLADPDSVCISANAHDMVEGKLDLLFEDIGEHSVKNITKPVRVYKLAVGDPTPGTHGQIAASTPGSNKPVVAVLPIDNLSTDPDQAYFSDGITEDLITELSRFRELSVISRNSSFVFKDKVDSLKVIGEKLGAQYIVEGSLQKASSKIRLNAQLIDAASDVHIWAERYDRDIQDIFAVQDDLVRRIASTIVGRMEAQRLTTIKRQSTDQLKAYDLFLRGREHFFKWSLEDNTKALELVKSAIELESENAASLALLAEILLRSWLNGWSFQPDKDLEEARLAVHLADEIDSEDSRTQTAMGMVRLFTGSLDQAERHFQSALRLNPNDTRVLVYYSRQAVFMGDTRRAINLCTQAKALNPYGKYNWNLGLASFVAQDYAGAINQLEGIRNPPETVLAFLAASLAMQGDQAAAEHEFARFARLAAASPMMSRLETCKEWQAYYAQRWPFRNLDDFSRMTTALRKAGLTI